MTPKLISVLVASSVDNQLGGKAVTLNPRHIVAAMPEHQIGRTQITFLGGNAIIEVPYTAFLKIWQAALEGREPASTGN